MKKKTTVQKPGLSQDEKDQLKQAFDLFDTESVGRIDVKQFKAAMQSLGFDQKNPTLYGLVCNLQSQYMNKGITFQEIITHLNLKLGDKQSREGIYKIFNLFIDDPNSETITLSSLRRIARELGETMTNEELKEMLERASSNGNQLTKEEFYEIMTKKKF